MSNSSTSKELQQEIGFYGDSPQVEELVQTIEMVAPTDLSVLINGESGTGKELIANAIHSQSKRSRHPLISVNCGAIPEGILESELFGHEKGSFTGAIGQKKGYFEAADHGTIFLDEIGEMPLNTQVKLLRVLETSEFMRVGGTTSHKVDVRIVAATNKNLEQAVDRDEFRRDLFFRLKAITITIPPLRKRIEDIPVLLKKFTDEYIAKNDIQFKGFAPEAVELMKHHLWPGNVRELRNFIETAIILNRGEIVRPDYVRSALNMTEVSTPSENLPVPLHKTPDQAERELIYRMLVALKLDVDEMKQMLSSVINNEEPGERRVYGPLPVEDTLNTDPNQVRLTTMSDMEKKLIKETLTKFNGSRRKAARALQISERTLYRKINEYDL